MNRPTYLLLGLALLPLACAPENKFDPPPPPEVVVAAPDVEDVTVFIERPGLTDAFERAEIRARVRGFLQDRHFEAGEFVEKGKKLFTIEKEPFEAAVASAEGELDAAKASLRIAEANLAARERAFKTKAVSEIEVKSAEADVSAAQAAIKVAEAKLDQAKIDLSYTDVASPIAGRVSDRRVDTGNLVGGADATLLTTVVHDDPIYVNFEFNERQILPYLNMRPGSPKDETLRTEMEVPIKLRLASGEIYEKDGKVDFIDNEVDPQTGTIRVRATFPNDDAKLTGGLFGSVLIPDKREKAVLVPTLVIQRDLAGDYVLVVDEENVVERRAVKAGPISGERRVVEEGLDGSERIVVQGLQRARQGLTVKPVQAEPASAAGDEGAPAVEADKPA